MFGNVGLIFRQRAQLLPWLLIIAVVGLERRALRKTLKAGAGCQVSDVRCQGSILTGAWNLKPGT
jgi:hypothetical protein